MEKILTSKEKVKLIQRHRKERDGRTRDRIKAVLAYDDEYSYSEIARILSIDDETIRRHIADYLKEKKLSTSSGGSDSKLSDRDKQKAFIKYYNRLKKIAGNKEPIYSAECVHPQHQTQLVYGLIFKGCS